MTIPIDDLEISVRIANALKNENIEILEDVCKFSESDLKEIPNFGKRSLAELKQVLATHGLELSKVSFPGRRRNHSGFVNCWQRDGESLTDYLERFHKAKQTYGSESEIEILARIDDIDQRVRLLELLANRIQRAGADWLAHLENRVSVIEQRNGRSNPA